MKLINTIILIVIVLIKAIIHGIFEEFKLSYLESFPFAMKQVLAKTNEIMFWSLSPFPKSIY